jgi:HK97 family phage major capsid protein
MGGPVGPPFFVETGMTDMLEASLELVAQGERIEGLAGEVAALKGALLAQQRPALDGVKGGAVDPARAQFVERYLRQGLEAGVELKSFSGASGAAGGYAVPREIDQLIDATLKSVSPIRGIANVVRTGTAGYRKLVTSGGIVSGWASETGARAETGTPSFNEIVPPSGELFANPAASQAMLDDAQFDVESWLASEIAREFAAAEGAAFVNGNGTSKPKGFLTYTTTNEADSVRAFGSLQYVASGAAGAFAASNPQDRLIDLVQSLRAPYRQGASFVMNSSTLAVIRKMKTSDGAFLWQPSMAAGQPATLLGYRVVEAEDMPDIAANSLSIAFGNFQAGYVIAERQETSILRDPFSNKPFVHFYAVKRIGGGVANSEAIKVMKFAAS